VVVDCSGRMDQTTRMLSDLSNAVLMVAQTDVVSLWSAGRIRMFLEEGNTRNRLRLVMNRYKKIPGFTEEEIEKVTNCKILSKIPNNYQLIAPAIDKGAPVAISDNQDVSRAFRALAELLAEAPTAAEEGLDLVFQHDKDAKKKSSNRMLINPLRAASNPSPRRPLTAFLRTGLVYKSLPVCTPAGHPLRPQSHPNLKGCCRCNSLRR